MLAAATFAAVVPLQSALAPHGPAADSARVT